MALGRVENIQRKKSGIRKMGEFLGIGVKDDEEEQSNPTAAPKQPNQQQAQVPQDGGEIGGKEMLSTGERFEKAQIQGEPKSWLERFAPTLIGVGGTAIAGLVGGSKAATDFGSNFLITSKAMNDEKKKEAEANMNRFEAALSNGRFDEAYSIIGRLPNDMMQGALNELKSTTSKEGKSNYTNVAADIANMDSSDQMDAMIKKISSTDIAESRKEELLSVLKARTTKLKEKEKLAQDYKDTSKKMMETQTLQMEDERKTQETREELLTEQLSVTKLEKEGVELRNKQLTLSNEAKESELADSAIERYRETGDTTKLEKYGFSPEQIDSIDYETAYAKFYAVFDSNPELAEEKAKELISSRKTKSRRENLEKISGLVMMNTTNYVLRNSMMTKERYEDDLRHIAEMAAQYVKYNNLSNVSAEEVTDMAIQKYVEAVERWKMNNGYTELPSDADPIQKQKKKLIPTVR